MSVTVTPAIGNPEAVPRRLGPYLVQIAIVFAATFTAGKLGDLLHTVNSGGIGPVWPAAGIALGAVLLWGNSVWPGIAGGAFLLTYLSPLPHWAAISYSIGTTLAAMIGAYLFRIIAKADLSLSRLLDVLALVVFGAIGSGVVSASMGAAILYAAHTRGWSGFGSAWMIYWLGDSTGVLIVTPLVLKLPTICRIRDRNRLTELALLLLLLTATCFIIFGDLPLVPVRLHVLAFAVLPFVMWAAIRFGMTTTALSILVISTIATVQTALGRGPFASGTPLTNAVLLDVFFAVLSISGLTLAAAIGEREQSERERERLVREQAVAEARLRFAAIVESTEDAIASGTLDGIIVSWNAGAQKLYGYTEAEAVGKPITILVPPELPDEENKILETLKAGGRIDQFETVRVTKTGKRINVSLSISPIKDLSGRTVGISGIARDITERKRAEEALHASEERLRLAQQAGRIGTFEWNIETGVNTWTPELEAMYGLPHGGLGGTQSSFENLLHPDDRARVIELIEAAIKTGQPTTGEWRVVWADGSVHWITGRWQVFMNESRQPVRMIGVNMDVTERKLSEDRLREYERAVEAAEEMFAVVDREYRIVMANRKYATMRNMSKGQVVGRFVHELLNKGVFDGVVKPKLDECFQGRVVRYEMKYTYPELGERDVAISYFPIDGTTGVEAAACIFQDITERKLAEEALAEMSRKLIEAQEQERSRIGRELHDDVNQRLALLAIELEQLKETPSGVGIRVQALRKQVTDISNDVQTLSHDLHSSKLEYLGVVAGMKSWCKEFGERHRMQIDCRHDVRSTLPQKIGLCLFRVLQEALHNAYKHSGVKRIEVQLREESGEIHLVVSDAGRGFNLDAALHGKGLGLTSMHERVRLVNGTISIESKPMGGTTIRVRVPLGSKQVSAKTA